MSEVVVTRAGTVRGDVAGEVRAFKGIPFAASPKAGPYRFQPPKPVARWEGVRDALEYGPTAPKAPYPAPIDRYVREVDIPGDDYLNLNVWTPSSGAGLPVMVFLHGGGFANGSNSIPLYDGTRFARDGVVLVSVNYRLGTEGFLYLEDGGHPNLGLQDQVAALEWVRDNITAFGGDPARVTVFGESAGAISIAMLLAMPTARGLFQRAILESGAAQVTLSPHGARTVAHRLAEHLGVPPTLSGIASVPVDQLVLAQQQLRAAMAANPDPAVWGEAASNTIPFGPVIDGHVLPGPPLANLNPDVDVLVGTNTEELALYLVPSGAVNLVTEDFLTQAVSRLGMDQQMLDVYRAERPHATPGELLQAVQTDWMFRIPAIRLAEAASPVWMYEFAWQPSTFEGRLGACHAAELPFVFDNVDDSGFHTLLGDDLPQGLADVMHSAWVSFATTGDPGWSKYGAARDTMRFDVESGVISDPRKTQRDLWDGIR